ncbi:Histone-lysine N-methyltransferase setd3, partial [Operophtera brumata]
MTRQNNIQLANCDITTDFNKHLDRGECFALRDFKPSDQIFIFYGSRPNADLFLHNGFVYPKNQHDSISITLGVSSSDSLRETKVELLTKLGLAGITHYHLYRGDNPISAELLAFIRIFNMNQGSTGDLVSSDEISSQAVGAEIDRRARAYLRTRCQLIRASYKTSEKGPTSVHRNNIKLLKECEVQILEGAIQHLTEAPQQIATDEKK